ncbi:uncharacterized protein ISCGN_015423 [Ixodes scapularis]
MSPTLRFCVSQAILAFFPLWSLHWAFASTGISVPLIQSSECSSHVCLFSCFTLDRPPRMLSIFGTTASTAATSVPAPPLNSLLREPDSSGLGNSGDDMTLMLCFRVSQAILATSTGEMPVEAATSSTGTWVALIPSSECSSHVCLFSCFPLDQPPRMLSIFGTTASTTATSVPAPPLNSLLREPDSSGLGNSGDDMTRMLCFRVLQAILATSTGEMPVEAASSSTGTWVALIPSSECSSHVCLFSCFPLDQPPRMLSIFGTTASTAATSVPAPPLNSLLREPDSSGLGNSGDDMTLMLCFRVSQAILAASTGEMPVEAASALTGTWVALIPSSECGSHVCVFSCFPLDQPPRMLSIFGTTASTAATSVPAPPLNSLLREPDSSGLGNSGDDMTLMLCFRVSQAILATSTGEMPVEAASASTGTWVALIPSSECSSHVCLFSCFPLDQPPRMLSIFGTTASTAATSLPAPPLNSLLREPDSSGLGKSGDDMTLMLCFRVSQAILATSTGETPVEAASASTGTWVALIPSSECSSHVCLFSCFPLDQPPRMLSIFGTTASTAATSVPAPPLNSLLREPDSSGLGNSGDDMTLMLCFRVSQAILATSTGETPVEAASASTGTWVALIPSSECSSHVCLFSCFPLDQPPRMLSIFGTTASTTATSVPAPPLNSLLREPDSSGLGNSGDDMTLMLCFRVSQAILATSTGEMPVEAASSSTGTWVALIPSSECSSHVCLFSCFPLDQPPRMLSIFGTTASTAATSVPAPPLNSLLREPDSSGLGNSGDDMTLMLCFRVSQAILATSTGETPVEAASASTGTWVALIPSSECSSHVCLFSCFPLDQPPRMLSIFGTTASTAATSVPAPPLNSLLREPDSSGLGNSGDDMTLMLCFRVSQAILATSTGEMPVEAASASTGTWVALIPSSECSSHVCLFSCFPLDQPPRMLSIFGTTASTAATSVPAPPLNSLLREPDSSGLGNSGDDMTLMLCFRVSQAILATSTGEMPVEAASASTGTWVALIPSSECSSHVCLFSCFPLDQPPRMLSIFGTTASTAATSVPAPPLNSLLREPDSSGLGNSGDDMTLMLCFRVSQAILATSTGETPVEAASASTGTWVALIPSSECSSHVCLFSCFPLDQPPRMLSIFGTTASTAATSVPAPPLNSLLREPDSSGLGNSGDDMTLMLCFRVSQAILATSTGETPVEAASASTGTWVALIPSSECSSHVCLFSCFPLDQPPRMLSIFGTTASTAATSVPAPPLNSLLREPDSSGLGNSGDDMTLMLCFRVSQAILAASTGEMPVEAASASTGTWVALIPSSECSSHVCLFSCFPLDQPTRMLSIFGTTASTAATSVPAPPLNSLLREPDSSGLGNSGDDMTLMLCFRVSQAILATSTGEMPVEAASASTGTWVALIPSSECGSHVCLFSCFPLDQPPRMLSIFGTTASTAATSVPAPPLNSLLREPDSSGLGKSGDDMTLMLCFRVSQAILATSTGETPVEAASASTGTWVALIPSSECSSHVCLFSCFPLDQPPRMLSIFGTTASTTATSVPAPPLNSLLREPDSSGLGNSGDDMTLMLCFRVSQAILATSTGETPVEAASASTGTWVALIPSSECSSHVCLFSCFPLDQPPRMLSIFGTTASTAATSVPAPPLNSLLREPDSSDPGYIDRRDAGRSSFRFDRHLGCADTIVGVKQPRDPGCIHRRDAGRTSFRFDRHLGCADTIVGVRQPRVPLQLFPLGSAASDAFNFRHNGVNSSDISDPGYIDRRDAGRSSFRFDRHLGCADTIVGVQQPRDPGYIDRRDAGRSSFRFDRHLGCADTIVGVKQPRVPLQLFPLDQPPRMLSIFGTTASTAATSVPAPPLNSLLREPDSSGLGNSGDDMTLMLCFRVSQAILATSTGETPVEAASASTGTWVALIPSSECSSHVCLFSCFPLDQPPRMLSIFGTTASTTATSVPAPPLNSLLREPDSSGLGKSGDDMTLMLCFRVSQAILATSTGETPVEAASASTGTWVALIPSSECSSHVCLFSCFPLDQPPRMLSIFGTTASTAATSVPAPPLNSLLREPDSSGLGNSGDDMTLMLCFRVSQAILATSTGEMQVEAASSSTGTCVALIPSSECSSHVCLFSCFPLDQPPRMLSIFGTTASTAATSVPAPPLNSLLREPDSSGLGNSGDDMTLMLCFRVSQAILATSTGTWVALIPSSECSSHVCLFSCFPLDQPPRMLSIFGTTASTTATSVPAPPLNSLLREPDSSGLGNSGDDMTLMLCFRVSQAILATSTGEMPVEAASASTGTWVALIPSSECSSHVCLFSCFPLDQPPRMLSIFGTTASTAATSVPAPPLNSLLREPDSSGLGNSGDDMTLMLCFRVSQAILATSTGETPVEAASASTGTWVALIPSSE